MFRRVPDRVVRVRALVPRPDGGGHRGSLRGSCRAPWSGLEWTGGVRSGTRCRCGSCSCLAVSDIPAAGCRPQLAHATATAGGTTVAVRPGRRRPATRGARDATKTSTSTGGTASQESLDDTRPPRPGTSAVFADGQKPAAPDRQATPLQAAAVRTIAHAAAEQRDVGTSAEHDPQRPART